MKSGFIVHWRPLPRGFVASSVIQTLLNLLLNGQKNLIVAEQLGHAVALRALTGFGRGCALLGSSPPLTLLVERAF